MKTPIIALYCRIFSVVAIIAALILFVFSFLINSDEFEGQIRISAAGLVLAGVCSILATTNSGLVKSVKFSASIAATILFGLIFGYFLYFWTWILNYRGFSLLILLIWILLVYPFLQCSFYIWQNHSKER